MRASGQHFILMFTLTHNRRFRLKSWGNGVGLQIKDDRAKERSRSPKMAGTKSWGQLTFWLRQPQRHSIFKQKFKQKLL